jgi:hypothetical protein
MQDNVEISPFGNNLIFKSGYTKEFVYAILKERHLDGIKINTRWENIIDFSFLSEYHFLESLDIVGASDFDFSFLFYLKKLKRLSISLAGNNIIDLSNQTNLESLSIQWRKGKVLGLDKCTKITSLCLVDYSEKDFYPISSLVSLEDLKVKTALINNLLGLENLTELKSILLGNCKKLSSLNGLGILKNVTSLSFDLCPQIKNYDETGNLYNLENLQITDCKGVESIKFIESLAGLKRLSLLGNTDVLDGNLMPAKKVREVFYKHRKHYNITIDNVEYDNLVKSNLNKLKGLFK